MALDLATVRWVSHLARLDLSDAELSELTPQIASVVDYIDQLRQVSTESVEPLAHPLPIANVFRGDELASSLPVDEALTNAPDRVGDFFGVPAVLE